MDIIKRAAQELKERYSTTSGIEKLLSEATSKENWQAHPKTLTAISDSTNNRDESEIISRYIWEKINASHKSATVTFKTLVLIEHLLKNGSPSCIMEFKDEQYKIRKLQDYQYVESGEDKGHNVRSRSKAIIELLNDKDKLDHERQMAKELRNKMNQVGGSHVAQYSGFGSSGSGSGSGSGSHGHSSGTSSNQVNASKYAGFSSDSYKDPKYQSHSSKDHPSQFYKSGDSYDSTEFKGLEKFRKKEEESQPAAAVEKKQQPVVTQQAPKQPEQPKLTAGQIKIAPPGATSGPIVIAKPPGQAVVAPAPSKPQQAPQTFDLFSDDTPAVQQKKADNDDDWGWTSAPPTNTAPVVVQAPSTQLYQQQQYPQTQQPMQQFYPQPQQQQQLYQQQQQYQQNNNNNITFNAPKPVVQQAPQKQVDLFSTSEPDFFTDFQSSTTQSSQSSQQKDANYSKDEFDLINLGDMKKEAEKKQKEKETKKNASNIHDLGFSTLTTQLDSFSFTTPSLPTTQSGNLQSQSNYSALNSLGNQNWGMQQQQYPQQMGYGGYPNQQQQGFPNANGGQWPQNGGYGGMQQQQQQGFQGYGAGYPQNNNFRM